MPDSFFLPQSRIKLVVLVNPPISQDKGSASLAMQVRWVTDGQVGGNGSLETPRDERHQAASEEDGGLKLGRLGLIVNSRLIQLKMGAHRTPQWFTEGRIWVRVDRQAIELFQKGANPDLSSFFSRLFRENGLFGSAWRWDRSRF